MFKVTAVSAGLEGATLDTEWQDPTSGFQYTKEVDIDGIVAYGTGQVEQVTVLVAERYNTTDYIEDYGFFVKLKDGAIGIDGKTVRFFAARVVLYCICSNNGFISETSNEDCSIDFPVVLFEPEVLAW